MEFDVSQVPRNEVYPKWRKPLDDSLECALTWIDSLQTGPIKVRVTSTNSSHL